MHLLRASSMGTWLVWSVLVSIAAGCNFSARKQPAAEEERTRIQAEAARGIHGLEGKAGSRRTPPRPTPLPSPAPAWEEPAAKALAPAAAPAAGHASGKRGISYKKSAPAVAAAPVAGYSSGKRNLSDD